jgi:hypothetical protein
VRQRPRAPAMSDFETQRPAGLYARSTSFELKAS